MAWRLSGCSGDGGVLNPPPAAQGKAERSPTTGARSVARGAQSSQFLAQPGLSGKMGPRPPKAADTILLIEGAGREAENPDPGERLTRFLQIKRLKSTFQQPILCSY